MKTRKPLIIAALSLAAATHGLAAGQKPQAKTAEARAARAHNDGFCVGGDVTAQGTTIFRRDSGRAASIGVDRCLDVDLGPGITPEQAVEAFDKAPLEVAWHLSQDDDARAELQKKGCSFTRDASWTTCTGPEKSDIARVTDNAKGQWEVSANFYLCESGPSSLGKSTDQHPYCHLSIRPLNRYMVKTVGGEVRWLAGASQDGKGAPAERAGKAGAADGKAGTKINDASDAAKASLKKH